MIEKLQNLLDFLFPQSKLDKAIAALTPEMLVKEFVLYENDVIFSFFSYEKDLVRHMIWKLKYRGDAHVAELFAISIADTFMEELGERTLLDDFKNLLLIPIPLSKNRLRERGYNQALIFAHALKKTAPSLGTIAKDVLVKARDTPPQTTLTKKERAVNLAGAFSIHKPQAVAGKNILLIDDVTTTGSTLKEARKVLKEAGARSVVCLAIAH